jgi:lipopolysaccharide transport system permease protein
MAWNPMATLVNAYQMIMVNGQWPQWETLIPISLIAVILCILGMLLFRKRAGEMVDEL